MNDTPIKDYFINLDRQQAHSHICSIFGCREEQLEALIPFLQIGLDRNEKCIYIADKLSKEDLFTFIAAHIDNATGHVSDGRLVILDKEEAYLRGGGFDTDQMLNVLKEQFRLSEIQGFSALRVTSEVSWILRDTETVNRFMDYELRVNEIFDKMKVTALCQYNKTHFPPEVLRYVILTHPYIIAKGRFIRNHHFIPVHNYLDSREEPDQIDLAISQISLAEDYMNSIEEKNRELEKSNLLLKQEITLRKKHEAELRTILDNIPVGIWTTDETGKINYGNKVGQEIWQGARYVGIEEFHEYKGWFLDTGKEIEPDDWAVARVIRNGEKILNERIKIRCFDGTYKTIINSAVPVFDDNRNINGAVIVNQDITDIRLKEEKLAHQTMLLERINIELQRSNRELEQFAYIASHDLQEPLRMVLCYSDLLEKKYGSIIDEKGAHYISFITSAARRMSQLIRGLLEYGRINSAERKFENISCNEIIKAVLSDLKIQIDESSATIELGDLPEITGDAIQFRQLFQNLLANAIKFRDLGNLKIQVNAFMDNKQWIFSFADNGIGIEPEFHEKIFGIFQQLHERGKYPGTGIGLALCKKIIENHGGRIWVESQKGKGSVFIFSVPVKN